ncbi:Ribonuclease BN, tRNA processing enzyme [Cognatiyoonia koreensis]|uniref:Ribonuclease BN, tRNA processing enzyme n=2 Tax=Cognatiyoonia koreensis TaxID=364200 RepID=A0A1I0NFP3_9RHOB|nr:Ribonuclease BN, tRNA processing enzyme [Cognatiyoonia koreensis]
MDRIVLLGVKGGPAVRKNSQMPTASLLQLVGHNIVIDCGIGVSRSCVEAGVSLLQIDVIFITHLHSDHVLELGPLLYTAWTTGLNRQITVYGPPGIAEYWDGFLQSMAFDQQIRIADEGRQPIRDLVAFHVFGEGPVASIDEIDVSALRVDHPPVTDCFALRFQTADKNVVFSSDTCYFPPLADFAKAADVLVHEAMLVAGVDALVRRTPGADRLRAHLMASHTPAADVGRIAADAAVRRLVLNHMVPIDDPDFGDADWLAEVAKTYSGPVQVGKDGMEIILNP